MVNAQEYINQKYPKNIRKEIKKLDISREIKTPIQEKLQGDLDLSDFIILEELDFKHNLITNINLTKNTSLKKFHGAWNQLTSLNVSECNNLETLYCHDNYNELTNIVLPNNKKNLKKLFISLNNFPPQDLTHFQEFVNLELLSIAGSPFYGSLKPLKNLTKLKWLNIGNTNIDSGLEYLPFAIEYFYCGCHEFSYRQAPLGAMKIWQQLESFKLDEYGSCDLKEWRKNSLIRLTKEKKELENKLNKQQEISRQVVEQLKEENKKLQKQQEKQENQKNNLQKQLNELQSKYSIQQQLVKQYLSNQEKETSELSQELAKIEIPSKK